MKTLIEEQLYLAFRDHKAEMALAWTQYFGDSGPWSVGVGDILRERADAIVSPANSYGYMDGGIDLAYRARFGLKLQNRLQQVIRDRFDGRLPIGRAVVIPTSDRRLPRVIAAPTMDRPGSIVGTDNVRLAMQAVLETALLFNERQRELGGELIGRVLIPGMGTGIGQVEPFDAAEQMRAAVDALRERLLEHDNDLAFLEDR